MEDPVEGGDSVLTPGGLFIDDAAWIQIGRDLKRLDPERYRDILRVAREIVGIYLDPFGEADKAIAAIGKTKIGDDFD